MIKIIIYPMDCKYRCLCSVSVIVETLLPTVRVKSILLDIPVDHIRRAKGLSSENFITLLSCPKVNKTFSGGLVLVNFKGHWFVGSSVLEGRFIKLFLQGNVQYFVPWIFAYSLQVLLSAHNLSSRETTAVFFLWIPSFLLFVKTDEASKNEM